MKKYSEHVGVFFIQLNIDSCNEQLENLSKIKPLSIQDLIKPVSKCDYKISHQWIKDSKCKICSKELTAFVSYESQVINYNELQVLSLLSLSSLIDNGDIKHRIACFNHIVPIDLNFIMTNNANVEVWDGNSDWVTIHQDSGYQSPIFYSQESNKFIYSNLPDKERQIKIFDQLTFDEVLNNIIVERNLLKLFS